MDQISIPQPLGRPRRRPRRLAGDQGYSNNRVRDWLRKYGIKPLIPRKENEKLRHDGRSVFDKQAYRRRSIVEQTIGWLKECRRIGTRFEKLAINFLAMMKLAVIQRCFKMAISDRAWQRLRPPRPDGIPPAGFRPPLPRAPVVRDGSLRRRYSPPIRHGRGTRRRSALFPLQTTGLAATRVRTESC